MNKPELLVLLELISNDKEIKDSFLDILINTLDLKKNEFHPLVFINGTPSIGENVYIGLFSEVNAKNSEVIIGDNCDIASFVSINVADSHKYTIGLSKSIERGDIHIENNVFIGSHSFIGKNVHIGHHSVVGAGTVLINSGYIPPNSLIIGNPAKIMPNHYNNK
jgi:acetyltransferase-like isoleucine patch superfamily enzyme